MPFITFSSDQLPASLDDAARFRAWQDRYMAAHGNLELSRPDDRPFSVRFSYAQYGEVGVGQFSGTIRTIGRGAHQIATRPADTFCLVLNRGRVPLQCEHRQHNAALAPGHAMLFADTEVSTGCGGPDQNLMFVPIPRDLLAGALASPEDLAGIPLDASAPATLHLQRYLGLLAQSEDTGDDALLDAHIGSTLFDLIVLALGCNRDVARRSAMRGVRAARVHEVIAAIRSGFADPACTPDSVGAELGLSGRYVQDLLQETGISFTERVRELRLQRARAALLDPRHDSRRISEIAAASGFREVSYFNRTYRRRFGEAPGRSRAGVR